MYNVMVKSKELIGSTECLTLQARYRINRCRYNRARFCFKIRAKLQSKLSSCSDSCCRSSYPEVGNRICPRNEVYCISIYKLGKFEKPCQFKHHTSLSEPVAYPGILFGGGGGSTNSVENRGQRDNGSGGGSPLVRGCGGSCNLVQEISFHIVKFS